MFLVLPDGSRSLSQGKLGEINVKNPGQKRLKMSSKVLILAPELNVPLVPLDFPQCTPQIHLCKAQTHLCTQTSDLLSSSDLLLRKQVPKGRSTSGLPLKVLS